MTNTTVSLLVLFGLIIMAIVWILLPFYVRRIMVDVRAMRRIMERRERNERIR